MKLRELGEFGLIGRIHRQVHRKPGVRIGIGDDAAAVEFSPGCISLITSDMLVEGIHFDLSLCDPRTLGRKSLAVNLSDIAAMGGNPRYFLLSLALPEAVSVEFLDCLVTGLLEMADEFDVTLIGGDTCASAGGLTISVTAMGEQLPRKVISRGGARPGDLVCVTGTLGDSALGLRLLRNGERTGPAVTKHLDPPPRVREGLALAEAGIPSAMIDVSDGLLADLGHILDLSGTGARLALDRVPLSPSVRELPSGPGEDPYRFPLSGGEDYELLFTTPPALKDEAVSLLESLGTPVSVIGEITPSTGLQVLAPDGTLYRPAVTGFDHFT
jgi:thiamine-monophosphate kinase